MLKLSTGAQNIRNHHNFSILKKFSDRTTPSLSVITICVQKRYSLYCTCNKSLARNDKIMKEGIENRESKHCSTQLDSSPN